MVMVMMTTIVEMWRLSIITCDDDGELIGNSQLPRSALLPNRVK